jgi:hypothetical protein
MIEPFVTEANMKVSNFEFLCLRPWFLSKSHSLKKQGYNGIEWQDIEEYYKEFAWKREAPKKFSDRIKRIQQLHANDYFDYAKLQATVYDVPPLEEMNIKDLL